MTEIADVHDYEAPQIERRECLDMPLVGFTSLTPV